MRGRWLWTVAAMAAIGGADAGAATLGDTYTSFFVLGDSLSDDGNLHAATGRTQPSSPPYYEGRFSNGPVWNEPILAEFAAVGLPQGNLAFGGATAIENGDAIPDLGTQRDTLLAQAGPALAAGQNDVVALWFGDNDGFAEVGDPAQTARLERAAAEIVAAAAGLGQAGAETVLVFTLPDLGATPRYALIEPQSSGDATAATVAFNTALLDGLGGVAGPDIRIVDAAASNRAATSAGLDPVTPCILGDRVCADPSGLAFFDPVHPTEAVHRLIEAEARAALTGTPAPVPLPAGGLLLVAALAAFGIRRRAAA